MTACNEYFARYRALPVWSSQFDEQQYQEYEDKLASTEESLVADFSACYPPASQDDITWFKNARALRTEVLCGIRCKGTAHSSGDSLRADDARGRLRAPPQQEPCLCTSVRCNFCTAPRERIFAPAVRKRF